MRPGDVLRRAADAVRDAATQSGRLRGVADNLDNHLDSVIKQIRDLDKYDSTVTTRGTNTKTTYWDRETGRPGSERGTILEDFGGGDRGDNATEVGNLGSSTDHGGHLGAHRFFGDTPDAGIIPQAGNLNTGAWKKMENEWAAWVGSGYQVDYRIDVYPPGAVRPDALEVEYVVTNPSTGEEVYRNFPSFWNEAGESFDRKYSRDMPGLP